MRLAAPAPKRRQAEKSDRRQAEAKQKKAPFVPPETECARPGPRRAAANIHGDRKAISPRTIVSRLRRAQVRRWGRRAPLETRTTPNRSRAFHIMTGVIIAKATIADTYGAGCLSQCRWLGESTMNAANPPAVRTALYFDSPAKPSPTPTKSQSRQAEASSTASRKNRRAAASAAIANPNSSGPSGTIQLPAEAKKKGVTLRAKSAISAARGPNSPHDTIDSRSSLWRRKAR